MLFSLGCNTGFQVGESGISRILNETESPELLDVNFSDVLIIFCVWKNGIMFVLNCYLVELILIYPGPFLLI
jgi:hypothetical protein